MRGYKHSLQLVRIRDLNCAVSGLCAFVLIVLCCAEPAVAAELLRLATTAVAQATGGSLSLSLTRSLTHTRAHKMLTVVSANAHYHKYPILPARQDKLWINVISSS
jgi:hypothetical protein